jgi:hypothetical protein
VVFVGDFGEEDVELVRKVTYPHVQRFNVPHLQVIVV